MGGLLPAYQKNRRFRLPCGAGDQKDLFYGLIFMILFFSSWISAWRPYSLYSCPTWAICCFWGWEPRRFAVTWNYAVRALGSVKTSVYIYMVPVITAVTSALILGEKITAASAVGILLTLGGLFLSQKWGKETAEDAAEGAAVQPEGEQQALE